MCWNIQKNKKKQYNDAIKAYEHIGNGVSWSWSRGKNQYNKKRR